MIDVQSLSFRYRGAPADAVTDVSFSIPSGTVFGLLGPSGAGKSTLQSLLIKLLPLQRGEVRFDGRSLAHLGRELFEDVGVSFEHPNLFPKLTGLENLEAFAGLYARRGRDPVALLDAVGLSAARDKHAADYSKGMKQRLVFARSLLHEPRYLFLDEPTSGLDPATQERIIDLVREERDRGATVLLTTHDMHVADALCDVIGLVHQGRLAACDTPRNLKLQHGQRAVVVERRDPDGGLVRETLFPDREADRARLQELVMGGDYETLHTQEATLADIFIRLTGQGLAS